MRIVRIDIESFGPFRDRQVLDFAAAAAGGLLLISGRTGAGKSSLLDAVSFALYGAVPRYDGQVSRVRSHHASAERQTLVRLDFEVAGERYRVERSPEYSRPAKRGGGTTTQKTEARLWQWDAATDEWRGLASRPVDVAALLAPVLRLNHQQFLQVVMLSQGGFQRFLRAADDERQATLRTLFQTERFADIEAALAEQRRELDGAARESEARIEGLLGGLEDALERDAVAANDGSAAALSAAAISAAEVPQTLVARQRAAGAAVAGLEARADGLARESERRRSEHGEAVAALDRARTIAAAQERVQRAEARKVELDEQRADVEALRVRLDRADRASRVVGARSTRDRARQQLAEADALWDEAWSALLREYADGDPLAQGTEGAEPAAPEIPEQGAAWELVSQWLTTERDRVARLLGSLVEAQSDEQQHEKLTGEVEELRAAVAQSSAEHEIETSALAALPASVAKLRSERERAALDAALEVPRSEDVARASTRLDAARLTNALAAELRALEERSAERAATSAERAATVSDLLARRIAGMAGELADSLAAGAPCPVCGSKTHPQPAEHSDPVTPEAIAHAEAQQALAQRALDDARAEEQLTATRHLTAREGAAGHTEADAAAALESASAALAQARKASAALAELDAQLSALEAEAGSRAERVSELAARSASLHASAEAKAAQAAALMADITLARAGFDRIAARVAMLEDLEAALERALSGGGALDSARSGLAAAEERLADELVVGGFAQPHSEAPEYQRAADEAAGAHLEPGEREQLRARVSGFDAETQRNAGELAAPDLAELDRTPVALEPIAEAAATASMLAESAIAEHAAAARISREHRSTLERVDREIAGSSATGEALLRLRRLADTLQGKDPNTKRMRLEVFVLAARLESIVVAANRRLSTMVGGRYRLQHDDGLRARGRQSGLGLAIIDEYTGRARSTDSLSGGETFLASLALALGLADVVTAESGGLELDTLFIDEGFGSLDPDALDQALATLDALREGGRTVALISHVAELKERLAGGLEVVADGQGVSSLRGDGVVSPGLATQHNGKDPR